MVAVGASTVNRGAQTSWLPIAIAVLTVAQFAMPNSLGRVEEAATMLAFIPVGWFLLRGDQ
jgi:hypothetical protein